MIDNEADNEGHERRLKHILKRSAKQSDKFIELARELECDESEVAFDEKMKKMLAVKLPPEKKEKGGD